MNALKQVLSSLIVLLFLAAGASCQPQPAAPATSSSVSSGTPQSSVAASSSAAPSAPDSSAQEPPLENWQKLEGVKTVPSSQAGLDYYVKDYLHNRDVERIQLHAVKLYAEGHEDEFALMTNPIALRIDGVNVIFYTDDQEQVWDTNGVEYGNLESLQASE